MIDLGKFLTILMLFEFGFSMLVMAMNQPYTAPTEMSQSVENTVELLKSHGGKNDYFLDYSRGEVKIPRYFVIPSNVEARDDVVRGILALRIV